MKRHYIELWALLVLAFVIFAVASAFDMPFKSAGIAEALFPDKQVVDTVVTDIDIEPEIIVNPCDTTSQTILFIGDSMLEGLSPRLAAYAAHNGHTLYTVIWYSSTSETWGRSDMLRRYIQRLKPTYVFISLGANELFVRNITERRRQYVEKIIKDLGDIPYVWIGPPNWAEDSGINDLIESAVSRGSYFRSKGMHFERGADGAHPTPASASAWLDSIARWMPANARYPIRLDVPADSVARPRRTFVHQPSER